MNAFDNEHSSNLRLESVKAGLLKRQIPPGYDKLIKGVDLITDQAPYSLFLAKAYTGGSVKFELSDAYPNHNAAEQQLFDAEKSPFGKELETMIKGKQLIDLGCGDFHAVPIIAEACLATRYIGIDKHGTERILAGIDKNSKFSSVYLNGDILAMLSRMEDLNGVVFHLSGLQPRETQGFSRIKDVSRDQVENLINVDNKEYIKACMKEMNRLCQQPGDGILLGGAVIGFHPERNGFMPGVQSPKKDYTVFIKV